MFSERTKENGFGKLKARPCNAVLCDEMELARLGNNDQYGKVIMRMVKGGEEKR